MPIPAWVIETITQNMYRKRNLAKYDTVCVLRLWALSDPATRLYRCILRLQ